MDRKSFEEGIILALASPPIPHVVKKQPIAYSYNGVILPALPELSAEDKEIYRHLVVTDNVTEVYAYACASLTAELAEDFLGRTYYAVTPKTPFLMCEIVSSMRDRNKWSEWEMVSDSAEFKFRFDSWTNHDIVALDGTTPYAGSETTPIYLPYVLYNGDEIIDDDGYGAACTIFTAMDFTYGDILRITINGVSGEYVVKGEETNELPYVGNVCLLDGNGDMEDDGGDFAFTIAKVVPSSHQCYFYTRTAGTYQLKIELIEQAKE
jgi:hypothetical protein